MLTNKIFNASALGDKRCGGVEKEGVSISPFQHKALIH